MDWTSLLAFTVALAIAAAIPGPGVAALVGRVLGGGFWPAVPMIAGFITGDLAYLSAAVLGLGVLAETLGEVFLFVRLAGAAYLLWLAWRFWTARPEQETVAATGAAAPLRMYLVGLSVTLGNPKVILFYLALLPTIVDIAGISAAGYAEIAAITAVVLTLVLGGYAAAVAGARRFVFGVRQRRLANRAAATAMMGAAAAMLVK
jgi:threonine/homoserine/homoserine lactone efflux protein